VWWNGGYFGSIYQVKALMPKAEVHSLFVAIEKHRSPFREQTPQAQLMNNFLSGAVGGFVGTVLNTPFVTLVLLVQVYHSHRNDVDLMFVPSIVLGLRCAFKAICGSAGG
jgi:hypothetical protein